LGGVFTNGISWRWCFWINLPICGIVGLGILVFLPKCETEFSVEEPFLRRLRRFDWIGLILFVPAIMFLLFALQLGGSIHPWNSAPVIILIVLFICILPIWMWTQFRLGEKATVPWRIISTRIAVLSSLLGALYGGAFAITSYYTPLYFQAVRGTNAIQSGIDIIPLILSAAILTLAGGAINSLCGYYNPVLIGGGIIATIGTGLMTTFGVNTDRGTWIAYEILAGAGGMNFNVL
jgi:MFS family permease